MKSCGSYYLSQARVIRAQRLTFNVQRKVQRPTCVMHFFSKRTVGSNVIY